MPIYDFECNECGSIYDALVHRIGGIEPCTSCGSGDVRKLVSQGSSFILQGVGWHRDGYGSPKPIIGSED